MAEVRHSRAGGNLLPEGWCVTTLDSVAEWGSGGTPSRKESSYYDGTVPWVKTGDLGPRLLTESSEYISELGVQNSSAKYFRKGSVAIAMYGATIGKTSILGIDATTNQACGVGYPIEGVTFSEFLYYFLNNEKDAFIAKGKGGAQPNISQALIKAHGICLPPLAEQKVIAEKLDTLLAQVDTTKARLERIPDIIKRFRQSVLAAAVSGKLTEKWRGSEAYSPLEGTIADFVSIDIGQAFKSKEFTDTGIRLLRGQNIEPGSLKWEETKYYPEKKLTEFSHLYIHSGDIILAMDRPIISTGLKLARAREEDLPCVLVQRVARFKNYRGISPDFLYLTLQDQSFTNYIQPNQTGSDIPHISGKQILAYRVKVPDTEEQTEIVRRVEELFAFADTIEQKAAAALERVNNLTQSILAKAFRGELTADWRAANPELIIGDNSAEALLAKIQAEREALKPVKKTRKKKA